MTKPLRVVQLVLMILGLLSLLAMLGNFVGSGAEVPFFYGCDDDMNCSGQTASDPSGFQIGVILGLLGIGLELAAVALGSWAQSSAAAPAGFSHSQPPHPGAPAAGQPQQAHPGAPGAMYGQPGVAAPYPTQPHPPSGSASPYPASPQPPGGSSPY